MGFSHRTGFVTFRSGFFAGFPSPYNTGPLPGTVFTAATGVVNSTADNQVIQNLFLNPGGIFVTHQNVVVRNCIVNGTGMGNVQGAAIMQIDNGTNLNLKVFNCQIYGIPTTNINSAVFDGIRGAMEVGYCDIAGTENAVDIGWPILGASYIHDNYIHDFTAWDPVQAPPDGSHCDGLQTFDISGSGGMSVIHNTILGWQTSGTFQPINQGTSSCLAFITGQHDLTVDFNLMAGGSYCMYGPSQNAGGGHPVNVKVRNNRFSTLYYSAGGAFGTHAGWDNTAVGFEWYGNVWHDGPNAGQVINVLPWPN
jgi:hypothetical protein